jgi:hypothetical protein
MIQIIVTVILSSIGWNAAANLMNLYIIRTSNEPDENERLRIVQKTRMYFSVQKRVLFGWKEICTAPDQVLAEDYVARRRSQSVIWDSGPSDDE